MRSIRVAILLAFTLISIISNAQTVIQMIEDGGVYKVPCEINGLKLKMVFDTGSAKMSISQSLAELMLNNGYISVDDIEGHSKSITADGRIIDHANVNIRTVKVGDVIIKNVTAAVINNQSTPLLFGQSAIRRLGEFSIKGDKLILYNNSSSALSNSTADYATERWDEKNYSYSNYTYGFGWTLPKNLEWERVQGHEKHTPFRAEAGAMGVFVNVQATNQVTDIWDVYDNYTKFIEQSDMSLEKKDRTD